MRRRPIWFAARPSTICTDPLPAGQWIGDRVVTTVAGVKGLAMSEREGARDSSGNEPSDEAKTDEASTIDEAALIREVVRMQELHREGGIHPDDEDERHPDSEA